MTLTTDMWTSEANDTYLGLTCHLMTADFELTSLCIVVEPFTEKHTGVNTASCLKQILGDFSIDVAVVSAVITDNASNMDDLVSEIVGTALVILYSWPLMMGLRCPLEYKKSAKAIVAFYNHSTKGTERLTELQEQLRHKLLSDCPTTWNSTYYMLAGLLEASNHCHVCFVYRTKDESFYF